MTVREIRTDRYSYVFSPYAEPIATVRPGNVDVPDTCPGNTVHLPVRVDGGLFYTGDAHAAEGDGELCGVACEVTARVRLPFSLGPGETIAWPRIESATELMTVGCGRPLDDPARIARVELVRRLEADYGSDRFEAYQLLTHAGRMRLGNLVDPQCSMVAKIERRFVPGA